MFGNIKIKIKLKQHKTKWRQLNQHNFTEAGNLFDETLVTVGSCSYGVINVGNDTKAVLKIGNYVSIGGDVRFLVGLDHTVNTVSTFPFKNKLIDGTPQSVSKGNIIVEDDVWIGNNSIILSGVTIGQGAVIAAGSVVTKDIPPYAIVGGVPTRVIKYRFEEHLIKQLMNLDYSKLTKDIVVDHIDDLDCEINDINQLKWFPKKGEAI